MTEPSTLSYSYSSASFYVIVEPSVIDDRQLRMPDTFVQKHGDELLDTVKLIVPTDDFWCVSVKKAGKMVWLHDGWQEFMEHHSIGYWYFLLFKYEQNSCFTVHIFDLAATEIDYQIRSHGNAKLRVDQDLSHGKEKVVSDKDGLQTEGRPESSAKSSELSHGAKRRKSASGRIKLWRCYETRSRTNKLHDEGRVLNAKNLNMSDTKRSFAESVVHGSPYNHCKRGRPRAAEANRATNAAKMFTPENPYFRRILKEYNVVRNYILNIPPEFVRDNMPKTSVPIELQDSDGNKWNAHCVRRKMSMFLSKGWRNFVRDNVLVVGDACVFELIKDIQADELVLKVHISRAKVEERSTN